MKKIIIDNKTVDYSTAEVCVHDWFFKEAFFEDGTPLDYEQLYQLDKICEEDLTEMRQNYVRE
jgi:hypothetical protein